MKKMDPKISMVTLGVSHLGAATEFYSKGLGLPLSSHSNDNISFFEFNSSWLGLYPKGLLAEDANVSAQGSGFGGITLAHNVESKERVNEVLTLVESAGANITKPAQDTFWGGYSGYFADLDNYLWEVAWNPFMELP